MNDLVFDFMIVAEVQSSCGASWRHVHLRYLLSTPYNLHGQAFCFLEILSVTDRVIILGHSFGSI